ncbi:NADPH:quinone reductase [Natrialbaceae archaeon AArc-T1-2]|uniref:NADPH:quinone reductase n=1 Tax=Natrialbaceae archaeon AArc-T1-2 TaxID=3053904 RepID=UPI00255ACE67|nr:NADPH:quinone reductase [Natrialbaceae archaeon AArc-T1-2]WIV66968.1 NADPH:quinone reductase [Natrialbaceae archaeon AArc-T1-2]
MRAVRYHDHGGPEVLDVEDVSRPEPGADELLVRVGAAAVNPVDTYFREGSYPPGDLPWIPGSDVAGVVEATGAETDLEEGDRIVATGLGNDHQGTCAEYVAVPETFAATLPDAVSVETAAAGALVGVTAWQSLIAACDLSPGERALVHGGSGGVGHLAVQLAAATGADVTTTASPEYHDRLAEMGAETVLDYGRGDLEDAILEAGDPDAILDHRLDDYLGLDCRVAAFDGDIAAIGNTDLEATFPNVPAARGKALSVHHVSMFNTPDIGAVLGRLVRLYERGDVEPVVSRTYDLEAVAAAQEDVVTESYLGKLVVVP